MKHILLFITLLTGSFSLVHAQENEPDPGKRAQKIQSLYIAYITQQLNLTTAEAEKFWPLHNQYDGEIKGVDLNMPELDRQQSILNIKKRYQDRFVKILGNSSRADNFFRLDNEFRKKLVDAMRNRRQQNTNGQRPLKRNN